MNLEEGPRNRAIQALLALYQKGQLTKELVIRQFPDIQNPESEDRHALEAALSCRFEDLPE